MNSYDDYPEIVDGLETPETISLLPCSTDTIEPLNLTFSDISYRIQSKQILHNICGYVPPGKFLAIMGPSGAGKTTLLDVLAERNKQGKSEGTILVNGQPRPMNFRRLSGYVMQEEAFVETLTVRETLYYAFKFRTPVATDMVTPTVADVVVQEIIDTLNLRKVSDTLIGTPLKRGISGGERRRLNIGSEMVIKPSLLFLDEPTSGLDARNALRVVKAIRHLCRAQGHTIVATLHQPRSNIFKMFDYLLLLSDGRMVYFGEAARAVDYFGNIGFTCPSSMNPADFLLDMLDPEVGVDGAGEFECHQETIVPTNHNTRKNPVLPDFPKIFTQSSEYTDLRTIISALPPAGELTKQIVSIPSEYPLTAVQQYGVLTARTWRATLRDRNIMYVRTAAAIAIGFLVGGIFFQQPNTPSSVDARVNTMLFLMCVFSLFCLPAITRFIKDKLLFTRERASGYYGTQAYFFSILSVEFPILLMIVIGYGSVSYWMVGLEPSTGHFIFFLAIILAVINIGFALSQVISAAVKSATLAIAIYMIILVYSLLLGGFIVTKNKLPQFAQWAVYTSYFWYGFQALIVNEFEDKSYGPPVIDNLDMGGTNKLINLGVLLVMWIVLQAVAFLLLHFKNKEKL